MPAISRTWRSTHSMPAAWSPLRRAGAPAGDRRTEVLRSLRIIFPQGKLQRVHTFSSHRFGRWPCPTHSAQEPVAALEPVALMDASAPLLPSLPPHHPPPLRLPLAPPHHPPSPPATQNTPRTVP